MQDKYYRDKDGNILRYKDGNPILLEHFANDPIEDDDDWLVEPEDREEQEEKGNNS